MPRPLSQRTIDRESTSSDSDTDPRCESLTGTARVEAFTDGVIRVVATLLVLELHVPQLAEHATYAEALRSSVPVSFKLVTFALGFLFVVIVWVNHHQVFHSLRGADRVLIWLNNGLLFWLCLLPFPTAFLGEYPWLPLAPMLLAGVLCASAISFLLLVRHIRAADLYDESVNQATRATIIARSAVGPPAFAVAALLALVSRTRRLPPCSASWRIMRSPRELSVVKSDAHTETVDPWFPVAFCANAMECSATW